MHIRTLAFSLVAVAVLAIPAGVEAGPPCVCWPVDAGDAPVIDVERRGATGSEIASKLLRGLDDKSPVLARMENLRRAAMALQGDDDTANYILSRLQARVLNAETGVPKNATKVIALRWFDAGYAVACFTEAGQVSGMDGYPWIARAIELSGADKLVGGSGAMHYAAALSVLMPKRKGHAMFGHHLQQMKAAAEKDALLAKNLAWVSKHYPPLLKYFADKKK